MSSMSESVEPPRVGPGAIDFRGKVVLITGGSRGIGSGGARAFVTAGAAVMILARDRRLGTAAARRLNAMGPGSATFGVCDVARVDEVAGWVNDVAASQGRVDTLVNNAAGANCPG